MTALIWDLDGTLFDSYDAILSGIEAAYAHYDLAYDQETVKSFILKESVHALFQQVAEENGIDYHALNAARAENLTTHNHLVKLLPGAKDILKWAHQEGYAQFIYTHKGHNAHRLLADLGVAHYFTEVVTGDDGFKRKPDPEVLNYLADKYGFEKEDAYYIGDRQLDAESARNAGVKSLNLTVETNSYNQHIPDLHAVAQHVQKK
ncbi:HAD-IA family hydrolase [Streptococcus moroccensis]|uniref:HAD superfamily hydrolase (TIGR01549 family) n=1 Tax=Streptococcus moroccensis TaxID=1451356 RepID=A0ABT9YSA1_9STRE|nr:HAD-IA family hydrolase [Streptococcus moroccensis]MDQ0222884.1 HAD superfamily hydrolase (TIGR01549 family) [Streptococcus moroccensis]